MSFDRRWSRLLRYGYSRQYSYRSYQSRRENYFHLDDLGQSYRERSLQTLDLLPLFSFIMLRTCLDLDLTPGGLCLLSETVSLNPTCHTVLRRGSGLYDTIRCTFWFQVGSKNEKSKGRKDDPESSFNDCSTFLKMKGMSQDHLLLYSLRTRFPDPSVSSPTSVRVVPRSTSVRVVHERAFGGLVGLTQESQRTVNGPYGRRGERTVVYGGVVGG